LSRGNSLLRAPTSRRQPASAHPAFDERLALGRDLATMIWQHRLWWVVPLLVSLALLGVLLVLEATPVGPFLYPLF